MRFHGGFTLLEALEACGPLLINPAASPPGFPLHFQSLDDPQWAGPRSLAIVGSGVRLEVRQDLKAAFVLAEEGISDLPDTLPVLRVTNGRRVLVAIVRALESRIEREIPFASGSGNLVGSGAVVEGVLEGDVTVGPGAYVGPCSFIGRGTHIEPHAVVMENCRIGRNSVVQSGAVIGSAGFGFLDEDRETMPHLSGVRIGDNCFVGANTVVAAGVLHPTEIGEGSKLDSHVQIAHNVHLGKRCLLASQSGIAGSTFVGDGLRMGGAASIAGHLRIGHHVSIAACSGVTKDIANDSVIAGFPARPIREWRKQQIFLKNEEKGIT